MALGYVDSDMPNVLQQEHIQNSLEILRMKRIVHNDNASGVCMHCEEPIPEARLLVVPNARYCVKCQSEADSKGPRIAARGTYTHI